MQLEPGTTLAHYSVIEPLGKGGMGEVYRARDQKLGRDVALKILPREFTKNAERLARFEREARVLASLDHPHVAAIYGLEDVDDVRFLVMQLAEGENLSERMKRGPLPIDEAVAIARQISEALQAAHEKGIVHRDLKPANVMVTKAGRVKVLDFGLAKITTSEEDVFSDPEQSTAMRTRGGIVMGTVPYMSPEQVQGRSVDHTSDIFSLGVILYEMTTGRRPFQSDSTAGLMSAILRDEPESAARLRPGLTPSVCRVIDRCLTKDPAERFTRAADVEAALRDRSDDASGLTVVRNAEVEAGERDTKSIVVLPFDNLSPDPDTGYFSDGLTDEIITDLSRIRSLRVISRSSAMRLKEDGRGLAEIARDLSCRYVLEGSVRRAANSLRITARLVDAPDDVQIWADKYGGTLDDVFDFQERVSRSIVDALEIRLTPQEAEQLAERPIPDVRAQECYFRARSEIWSFLPTALDRAISQLEAGLKLIGDNALLYQGLGEAWFQYVNVGGAVGREEEFFRKAESCAEKIFAIEQDSPRGHLVLAPVQLGRGDIHGCVRSLRRVLQTYPNDVQALFLYTHVLGWLGGKPHAAAPFVAHLLDVDPLSPTSHLPNAMLPLFAGRFSEAIEPARRMFDLDPVTPVWRANFVMALAYDGRLDEAESLTEGLKVEPGSDVGTWWMGILRAAWREDRAEVIRLANGPYQQTARWDSEIPWVLATTHAAVGLKEEALLWLDRTIEQGMINYPFLSEHDRYLDSIRNDVRFDRLMERTRRQWNRLDEELARH